MARGRKAPGKGLPGAPDKKDLALWRYATRDVEPLEPRPAREEPPPPPEREPEGVRAIRRGRLPSIPVAISVGGGPPPKPPPLGAGTRAGVDTRTAERLRRGRLAIDGRIDLHGLGREEAHLVLRGYLLRSHALGRRCILVITGKGRLSAEGRAVLRDALPDWLNEPDIRPLVVAFTAAQPRHGGEGAFYVLLKRQREPPVAEP